MPRTWSAHARVPYEITSNFMPVISHPASITPRVVLFRHCMIETKDAPQIACPSIIHYIQIRERLDAQDDRSTHVSAEGHELRRLRLSFNKHPIGPSFARFVLGSEFNREGSRYSQVSRQQ